MKNPRLLSQLAPLLLALLAVSSSLPLTAAMSRTTWRLRFPGASLSGQQSPELECIGDGVYAANSTYQANLRRLAALLAAEYASSNNPGESSSSSSAYAARAVGYWPNRLTASSLCWSRRYRDANDTTGVEYRCDDCVAEAFLEVEKACPYRREASYSNGNCSIELAEIRVLGTDGIFWNILEQAMASGLVFEAIGFGWLFFLLFQEWRSRKRGTLMNSTPLLSGDLV